MYDPGSNVGKNIGMSIIIILLLIRVYLLKKWELNWINTDQMFIIIVKGVFLLMSRLHLDSQKYFQDCAMCPS